jgi:hypothetical protein
LRLYTRRWLEALPLAESAIARAPDVECTLLDWDEDAAAHLQTLGLVQSGRTFYRTSREPARDAHGRPGATRRGGAPHLLRHRPRGEKARHPGDEKGRPVGR